MSETVTQVSETEQKIVRSRTCGCRDFYIAKLTQNDAKAYVAETPVKLARAIKAKVDEKWSSEKIYSDDGTEEVINSYEGTEIELEVNALAPQEDVNFLPETYVIFITEHDVIGKGEPIYRVERKILETDEFFDDGSHILYVNGAYRGDSDIGKLMHDFSCTDADDMFYGKLADRVRYFKEDAKGVESMCKAIEEMRNQEREEVTREFVVRMIRDGETSVEKMARYSGLSLDEVKEIVKQEAVLA